LVGRVIPNPPLSVSDPSDRRVKDNAPYPANATLLAFAAALLWTLHPLQTEAVTYIVQRAESLMGLFYLLTLYCFIRGAEPEGSSCRSLLAGDEQHASSEIACKQAPTLPNTQSSHARCWFAGSVGACLLGMATKEVMVSAPLIVLLYDRTFIAGSFREAWRRRAGLYAALAATWLVLIGLVASTGWNRHGASGFDVGIAPWAYWLTQFEAVSRYVGLSVWPDPLVFEYGTVWVNHPAEVALYALLVVGLAVAGLVALCRRPVIGFLGAWFFAILAPTSIVPGRVQMIVEHRMYLPLAAVMTLAAIGIHAMLKQRGWVVFIALALGLGLLTARRNEDYRSELSIWSDTVAKRPNNERAHGSLGNAWSKIPGRLDDAIAQFEKALRLNPNLAETHNNLGNALKDGGRTKEAIAQYEAALRLQPDLAVAHNNLGSALNAGGRTQEAIVQYEAALRLKPDLAEAHDNLGNALNAEGRIQEAIVQYEEALRLKPDDAQAHADLGFALEKMPGRMNDAIAEYDEALRLKPDDAAAHNNLGSALNAGGRTQEAMAQYEEALRLKPDFAEAHYNLGLAWAHQSGRMNDAIAQYEEALRLKPNYAEAQSKLGNALHAEGRTREAIARYETALRLKPDLFEAHNNLGNTLNAEGRTQEAIAHYEAALRLKPDLAETHNNLGNALHVKGRTPEAIAQYEAALRLKPDDAAAHFNLAVAMLEIPGRGDEAAGHLETVLRLQPGNEPARQILARIRAPQR
jgi:tetratricopeptide (TPR) repeat protein